MKLLNLAKKHINLEKPFNVGMIFFRKKSIARSKRFIQQSKNNRAGLTLVELAIVILVIGIIMTIVVTNLDFGVIDKAKIQQVNTQRYTFMSKMKIHDMEGNAAIQEGDLITILEGIDEKNGKDPFGKLYTFCQSDSGRMHICSYGKDGEPGGEGDNQDFFLTGKVKNWPDWLQNKKKKESDDED